MPDLQSTLLAILLMALATYLTRVAGYFLGSRISPESVASRVLGILPGAALAGVLALSLVKLPMVDVLAVAIAVVAFLLTGRTLIGIATGLILAVSNAHLLG